MAIGQSTRSLRGDGQGLVQVTQLFLGGLPCYFEQSPYNNSVAIRTPLLHDFGK